MVTYNYTCYSSYTGSASFDSNRFTGTPFSEELKGFALQFFT